jgi:methyl-accepting chemotaxis protein
MLKIEYLLGDDKIGFKACRAAYLPAMEEERKKYIGERKAEIEARRLQEAAAAARGPRRGEQPEAAPPPGEVPFTASLEFDLSKYKACTEFQGKALPAIAAEMNGQIFTKLGYGAAAVAFRQVDGLTPWKVQFVWLIDPETGRGIAKNAEFSATTADRFYYQKTMAEIFEGLTAAVQEKILSQVRAGAVYRDMWVTRADLGDTLTGYLHVALVPVRGPAGDVVAVVAVAVRVENLARIARAAHAKLVLLRKALAQGAETLAVVGDGNDDETGESLAEDLKKKLVAAVGGDARAVAGVDPLDAKNPGVRPARDFAFAGTDYLVQVSGVVNGTGKLVREDASFAIGPVAIAVLVDKTHVKEALSTIWQVWIFTGVAFVICIIVALLLAQSFIRPITLIEDGLLRIMNGDWTHRFDVRSAELGGLSYRINQLMAALLGDEEEEGAMVGGEEDPREVYYRQLYEKFQAAQVQIRQDPNSVSYTDFRARLVENERKILEKNPGKQVEFEIVVAGNQITFRPILK